MQVCCQHGDRLSDLVLPRLPKGPTAVCNRAAEEHLGCTRVASRAVHELEGKEGVMAAFPVSSCYLMQKKRAFLSSISTHYLQY